MPLEDPFADIARYYDPIMEHVDYARWQAFIGGLRELLPANARHLDAGCGTGTLLHLLRSEGWRSVGIDLSPSMVTRARRQHGLAVAVADLRALPFAGQFNLVTCLFDSLNFILDDTEMERAIRSLAATMTTGALLYFDVITERMVRVYFEGPGWTEQNGGFSTTWKTRYDTDTLIADTTVQVNGRPPALIRERVYPLEQLRELLKKSGLTLLDMYDVETWRAPTSKTTRVDFVAAKEPSPKLLRDYADLRSYLKTMLGKG